MSIFLEMVISKTEFFHCAIIKGFLIIRNKLFSITTFKRKQLYNTICRDAPPPGYQGYRMALSDVVELYDDSGSEFYYCDRVGFQPIRFEQKQDPCINMTL